MCLEKGVSFHNKIIRIKENKLQYRFSKAKSFFRNKITLPVPTYEDDCIGGKMY